MFEMKPEFFTGIELIDNEHRQLFDYANQIYELLHAEFVPDKYDNIVDILGKLRDYTKKHFADEEAYMESIQYKKIFTQKVQHQAFIDELDKLDLDEISELENQDETIGNLLSFVTDWLIHHILEVDTQIGK
ncbi:MAG: bacteriohemerythrin [Lachnospiraceae bacterium]|nr:bacteriohemerythrin [Lachnospiraceae bacterium]